MNPDIFLPNAFDERLAYFEEHRSEICEFYGKTRWKIDEDFRQINRIWQIDMPANVKMDYLVKCYLAMRIFKIRHNRERFIVDEFLLMAREKALKKSRAKASKKPRAKASN